MPREGFGNVANHARFVGLPAKIVQNLRVRAAVPHDFVAPPPYAFHDLRRVLVEQAVRVVGKRHAQFLCKIEQPPKMPTRLPKSRQE